MLKEDIIYEDFNGEQQTKTFYFNLSKAELAEMQLTKKGGLAAYLEEIIDTEQPEEILRIFKKLILQAVGQKSSDGQSFVKSDEIRTNFENHAAYSALYMKLIQDENAAVNFFKGVIPADLASEIDTQKSRQNIVPTN